MMSAPRAADRRGITLVEVVIAIVVFALCVIPCIGLFNLGYESATISEDRIYAETLASRILEVWDGLSFDELSKYAGKPVTDVVQRIYNGDKTEAWFTRLPEYEKNFSFAQNYFQGQLDILQVEPGLLSLEVAVQWTVVDGAKRGETRQFKLVTFRCREDLSVDSREGGAQDR